MEYINTKILKISVNILEHHPELSGFLAEMPETIPNEEHPAITQINLKKYCSSLEELLEKYINNKKLIKKNKH